MTLPKNPENEAVYQQKEDYLSTYYCVDVFLDEYMLYVADSRFVPAAPLRSVFLSG